MLKDTVIKSGILYLGKNAGRTILDDIEAAKHSIKILTPYIAPEFIDTLINKSASGVDVSLIISSDFTENRTAQHNIFRKLINQYRHVDEKMKSKRTNGLRIISASYIVAALFLILGYHYKLKFYLYGFLAFPIIMAFHAIYKNIRIYTYSYKPTLNFCVTMSPYTDGFNKNYYLTHAKMYIIDNKSAYIGSMNFTKAAFWYHYESRIKIDDPAAIEKMNEEFSYLSLNENTVYLDIGRVIDQIYIEPPN